MDNRLFVKASRIIEKLISKGFHDFIIYPFGQRGMEVKWILNQRYGIKEKLIVDNNLSKKCKHILSIDEMKALNLNNMRILLCSDKESSYNSIRNQIYKICKRELIVDVFSHSMFFDDGIYCEPVHFDDIRIASLELAAREIYVNKVPGATAECGVHKGGFAKFIGRLLPERKMYLFDTFSGFDARDIDEKEERYTGIFRKEWKYVDTSVEIALQNIGTYLDTIVKCGYFPETAADLQNERFSLVSLDTDLYKPILAGLEFFYPRMNPGGYIFVHDFGLIEGVRQAVLEYCSANNLSYVRLMDTNYSVVISKPLGYKAD